MNSCLFLFSFFFNDTAATEIYTLSLHDALPICLDRGVHAVEPGRLQERRRPAQGAGRQQGPRPAGGRHAAGPDGPAQVRRSEEHTSELQSRQYLVCRLLLEKKNTTLSSLPHVVD